VAPVASRWLMLWVARAPAAREGLGATFARQVTSTRMALAAVAPAIVVAFSGPAAVAASACAALAVAALIIAARRRLGGVTGDVMGCAVEVAEAIVLVVLAGGGLQGTR
jgi:adenosylcobinamide-GDP ribazoletransferase